MDDLRFHQPVRSGDTLRVELEVIETTDAERHADRGYITFEQRILDGDGELVLSLRMETIVRRAERAE
jgi:acyl dehydratase